MRRHGFPVPVVVVATLSVLLCQWAVNATVLLRTTVGFTPISDAAASFGQQIPLDGIFGHVLTTDPEDACASSIAPTRKQDVKDYHARDGLGWIALTYFDSTTEIYHNTLVLAAKANSADSTASK